MWETAQGGTNSPPSSSAPSATPQVTRSEGDPIHFRTASGLNAHQGMQVVQSFRQAWKLIWTLDQQVCSGTQNTTGLGSNHDGTCCLMKANRTFGLSSKPDWALKKWNQAVCWDKNTSRLMLDNNIQHWSDFELWIDVVRNRMDKNDRKKEQQSERAKEGE